MAKIWRISISTPYRHPYTREDYIPQGWVERERQRGRQKCAQYRFIQDLRKRRPRAKNSEEREVGEEAKAERGKKDEKIARSRRRVGGGKGAK